MSHIHLTQDDLIGEYHWGSGTKLFNIIFVGATKEIPAMSLGFELHRFISSLTDMLLKDSEKFIILEQEYGIDITDEIEREVNTMCNLGEGILEMGIEQGIARGIEQGIDRGRDKEREQIVLCMHKEGCTPQVIAKLTGIDIKRIDDIIDKHKY